MQGFEGVSGVEGVEGVTGVTGVTWWAMEGKETLEEEETGRKKEERKEGRKRRRSISFKPCMPKKEQICTGLIWQSMEMERDGM